MTFKTVVLFNHKGGVSKTTSTYNIAWKLTDLGKRVLLVDGDPQCNLTSLLLDENFYSYYKSSASTAGANLMDAVRVAFEGRPRPISPIDCFSPTANNNLFLLPGHPNLSEYDPSLSLAMNSNNAITTLQNLPGAFSELINQCSSRYNIDYVLIDMNPGLSAINQSLFLSSDAFIIPTNPDPFSVMAVKTLAKILPRWKQWAINSRSIFQDAAYPLPVKENKFAGYIVQRFNLRKGRAAKPYQDRITEIGSVISDVLMPELAKNNMCLDLSGSIAANYISSPCLAEISDFGALLQKSHKFSKPIFKLSDDELGSRGPIYDQLIGNRQRFDLIFTNIANTIITSVI